MAGIPIQTAWLEEGKDMAECPVCLMVPDQPTVGCPEGHALCRQCYVAELHQRKKCPVCGHTTDESRLLRCRLAEGFIGQLRMRCKHGPEDGAGGGEGGAPPRAKRAKLEPAASMDSDDLREELGRRGLSTKGKKGELVARLEEHWRSDAGVDGEHTCSWRGRVCQFVGHLSESCAFEPVKCPNAVAGCTESVLRKDAARHASETCAYRKNRCAHCAKPFEARALAGHEIICPSAQIECPNPGCGVTVARGSLGEHRGGCGREEVGCPCPGCEERMVRAEVEEHVAASGAEHLQRAWGRAVKMEERVAEQEEKAEEMEEKVTGLEVTVEEQAEEIAALRKRGEALTRVFTWSTDSEWSSAKSASYTFTDGVRGRCYNDEDDADGDTHFMGLMLTEGPACTMHFKCSILDKDDKVLRVVSDPALSDFREPPNEIASAAAEKGHGVGFVLTAADKAGAVRADGSMKLCMVVHLYLPWV